MLSEHWIMVMRCSPYYHLLALIVSFCGHRINVYVIFAIFVWGNGLLQIRYKADVPLVRLVNAGDKFYSNMNISGRKLFWKCHERPCPRFYVHTSRPMTSSTKKELLYQHRGYMMTSSNGNIFRVTGPLCGEFTGPRWIHRTKASDAELWCFLWSVSE